MPWLDMTTVDDVAYVFWHAGAQDRPYWGSSSR